MKAKRLTHILLLLIASVVHVSGQQDSADRKAFLLLKTQAEKGDAALQCLIAALYALGVGVTNDNVEAVRWYRKAAEQGNPGGECELGNCYLFGRGVERDAAQAVTWYRKAAEKGNAPAQNILGLCYLNGDGVATDYREAVKWFRRAAEQSDTNNLSGLAKEFEPLRKAVERENADAQFNLGYCYGNGVGVDKDVDEAARWYRKAADREHVVAQNNLGICFAKGEGVAKDFRESAKWYRKAAEQGLAAAQYNLAECYGSGEGVSQDFVEAVNWYHKAADQGLVLGQFSLGASYHFGKGVAKDPTEAVKWYRRAAEQGEGHAQNNLAMCYSQGEGVAKSKAEAAKWFRQAAEQGLAAAQSALGSCYGNGDGVPKDYVEAYKWLNLASAQGNEDAKQSLSIVELWMTREQIAEAQVQAREFKPRKTPASDTSTSPKAISDFRAFRSGTGFFISEEGFLITNEHVVKDATQVRLVTSAGLISARVVKVDAANDLALLKAEGRFVPLPVAASRGVKLGSMVATVGFPNIGLQGFAPKLAKGEIASLSGAQDDARYFQISVPVQPGNSGGALVDERGNVVGVVSARLSDAAALRVSGSLPQNVNYAVKSSYLLSFLESVPEVAAKLKEPESKERKFEEVVKSAEQAAVLVLVY